MNCIEIFLTKENGWNVEYCINQFLEGNFGRGNPGTPKLGEVDHQGSVGTNVGDASAGGAGGAGVDRTLSDADLARY